MKRYIKSTTNFLSKSNEIVYEYPISDDIASNRRNAAEKRQSLMDNECSELLAEVEPKLAAFANKYPNVEIDEIEVLPKHMFWGEYVIVIRFEFTVIGEVSSTIEWTESEWRTKNCMRNLQKRLYYYTRRYDK